jgi:hypothetical protein
VLLLSSLARAFVDPAEFRPGNMTVPHPATISASAEGVYFTGAPRFAFQTCSSCHIDTPGIVGIKLGADELTLFTDGYEPGRTYSLEVEMLNESEGLDHNAATCTEAPLMGQSFTFVPCNNNNFALEIDAADKPLTGFCAAAPSMGMCPAPAISDEVVVMPGGDAIIAARQHDMTSPQVVLHNGKNFWRFWWTAPPAGTGPVTVYLAAVDGGGGNGTVQLDQDPENDDVVTAAIPIPEKGAEPPVPPGAGCAYATTTRALPVGALLLVGLAFVIFLRRRAR